MTAGLPELEWFVLARAGSLTAQALRAAARHVAGAAGLVGLPPARLEALGLSARVVGELALPDLPAARADRDWAARAGVHLLTCEDPRYPPLLAGIEDAPPVLWVRGDPAALCLPQVAIVGSRHPTAGGQRTAAWFARSLGQAGLAITSGLARGIDAAAHRGALEAGAPTVAVCGTGLALVHPRQHAQLADRVAAAGALVSEFPPRMPPLAHNFPRRNRIISGLSTGVLVVEATLRSGSLVTAGKAADQGRQVLAVPGSVHSELSRGCHSLLRDHGAGLAERPDDVLAALGGELRKFVVDQAVTEACPPDTDGGLLDKAPEMLLDALGFEPASIEDLAGRTGRRAADIAADLALLELEGLVDALPGGLYSRVLNLNRPANRKVN